MLGVRQCGRIFNYSSNLVCLHYSINSYSFFEIPDYFGDVYVFTSASINGRIDILRSTSSFLQDDLNCLLK